MNITSYFYFILGSLFSAISVSFAGGDYNQTRERTGASRLWKKEGLTGRGIKVLVYDEYDRDSENDQKRTHGENVEAYVQAVAPQVQIIREQKRLLKDPEDPEKYRQLYEYKFFTRSFS